jgi:hypothetical protein
MKTASIFSLRLFRQLMYVLSIVLISLTVTAQPMQVKDALACIGLPKSSIFKKVQAIGYVYKGVDSDFYKFSKDLEYYSSDLSLAITNNYCNVMSWNVHIIQGGQVMGDVLSNGFELNEEGTRFNVRAYKNYDKRLVLTLIERTSTDNMIIITIGRMAADE